jgi:hypothetical protein
MYYIFLPHVSFTPRQNRETLPGISHFVKRHADAYPWNARYFLKREKNVYYTVEIRAATGSTLDLMTSTLRVG